MLKALCSGLSYLLLSAGLAHSPSLRSVKSEQCVAGWGGRDTNLIY